jgi:hypothetical protein
MKYHRGSSISSPILTDSIALIKDCFAIQDDVTSFLFPGKPDASDFVPLLFSSFPGMSTEMIIDELKEIFGTMEGIKEGKNNLDITKPFDFFRKLSMLCLSRNNQETYTSPLL